MKIRIGSTKYDLTLHKEFKKEDEEDANYIGYINGDKGVIQILSGLNSQAKRQTFWHEVVHGITDELGLGDLKEDEDFIDSFGKMLYGFFEDNNLEKIYEKLGE